MDPPPQADSARRGVLVPLPRWSGIVVGALLAVLAVIAGLVAIYFGLLNLYDVNCQTYSGGVGSQTYYTDCGVSFNSGGFIFTMVGLFFFVAGVAEGWTTSARFEIRRFADREI